MTADNIVIVGAGIGGLVAALRLALRGASVVVLEKEARPGGKMRNLPSAAGPVAAGPTVFTLKPIFDALFREAGAELEQCVTIHEEKLLARHFWPDGSSLDLCSDRAENVAAVRAFAGAAEARRFERFCDRARLLFETFEAPVMRADRPDLIALTKLVARQARRLLPALAPWSTLASNLKTELEDPRLRQLFGRYATYVGGSPYHSPAVLGLIWEAEARGVWRVEGGMVRLAAAIEALAREKGARFRYGAQVAEIETRGRRVAGVRLSCGERIAAQTVLFNGDPAALRKGLLGQGACDAVSRSAVSPRSLSAYVWSFAAQPHGADLAHHTVFFGRDPRAEFGPLAAGRMPDDPTLYVCAQDRGAGAAAASDALERFEIIMNGPPGDGRPATESEAERCAERTFQTLERMGLSFSPTPAATPETLTTPTDFAKLFPGSSGSLYGRSPHGLAASFRRPTARSRLAGLYLAGGGVHPGAGAPMAALSGARAAEAIWSDRTSRSERRQTATPGGISTASQQTDAAPSR